MRDVTVAGHSAQRPRLVGATTFSPGFVLLGYQPISAEAWVGGAG